MGSRKTIQLFIAALVPAAVACCASVAQTPPAPPPSPWATSCTSDPKDHKIEVGTQISCKLAFVSKNAGHVVTWKSIDANYPDIKIVFDDPDAFKNIKDCSDGKHVQCNSGAPTRAGNPNWVYLYKAWVCKDDGASCNLVDDPGIIIVP